MSDGKFSDYSSKAAVWLS